MDILIIIGLGIIWWLIGIISLLIFSIKMQERITVGELIISLFCGLFGPFVLMLVLLILGMIYLDTKKKIIQKYSDKVIWSKK